MNGIDEIRSKSIDFEMPLEWGIKKKKEYLSDVLVELREKRKKYTSSLVSPTLKPSHRELIFMMLDESKSMEAKAMYELKQLQYIKNAGITDDMIREAKEFPITNLLEVTKEFALCPFHTDKKPSFYVKNNYGHCFSCGENADTIKIVMQIKNMDFKSAVNFLVR